MNEPVEETFEDRPDPFHLVYDPQTDTVYDLMNCVAKELQWTDAAGNRLKTREGQPARLCHFWNAASRQYISSGPLHPQTALSESVALFMTGPEGVVTEEGREGSPRPFDQRSVLIAQFAFGLGLFLSRRGIVLQVAPRKMDETELSQVKKRFGYFE